MTTLPASVQTASSSQLGFDTDTAISSEQGTQFYNSGYRFCIRYLSRGATKPSSDLTNDEAA